MAAVPNKTRCREIGSLFQYCLLISTVSDSISPANCAFNSLAVTPRCLLDYRIWIMLTWIFSDPRPQCVQTSPQMRHDPWRERNSPVHRTPPFCDLPARIGITLLSCEKPDRCRYVLIVQVLVTCGRRLFAFAPFILPYQFWFSRYKSFLLYCSATPTTASL